MYGYTEEEAIGKPITILVPTELPDEENNILETLKAGGRIEQFETVRVTKTGKRINVSLSISPIKDSNGRIVSISGIARDITERKLAEEGLRESEKKFRSVFRDAGVGMVIVSPEGRFLAANATFCDCLGYTEEELLAKTVESVTCPEDWPAFSQKLGEAITEGIGLWRFQKRCLHKSGRIVYTESNVSLMRNRDGELQYFVGGVLDVTKRKESEEALSDMTRKLVEAQEKERARIARELHDDISQRLAMLSLELEELQENPSELQPRVKELRRQMAEVSNDVQALSHDLHSSKLEYLGVVAGIKSWCKEFAERQKFEIDFRSDVSSILPLAVGFSLFRLLQEALNNAIKHSGVKRIEIQLRDDPSGIHLVVRDSGRGFDVEEASQGKGLGLTSMRERVRLVNGTISIESKPMGGTTIHVRVPFGSEQGLPRAAG
jgi:PAS domain S-box-containing protein